MILHHKPGMLILGGKYSGLRFEPNFSQCWQTSWMSSTSANLHCLKFYLVAARQKIIPGSLAVMLLLLFDKDLIPLKILAVAWRNQKPQLFTTISLFASEERLLNHKITEYVWEVDKVLQYVQLFQRGHAFERSYWKVGGGVEEMMELESVLRTGI